MKLYLYIHLFTIAYPLAQSFEWRLKYYTKWKALFPGLVLTAAFFIVWDVIFTDLGVWGFNEVYLIGFYIFGLPIEEWLFFVTVPFASVFIYECVLFFFKRNLLGNSPKYIAAALSVVLIALSLIYSHRLYTFYTFLFTGILLVWHSYKNFSYLGDFLIAYLLHLIPFFLVNGVLTGSWIEEPIVWYNDVENLSIRLGTIPIEDSIYSMLLLLMNITFYEYFKNRFGLNTLQPK